MYNNAKRTAELTKNNRNSGAQGFKYPRCAKETTTMWVKWKDLKTMNMSVNEQ